MKNEWNPRAEILAITHRWTLPFLAFIIGSLIGWGFALIYPAPYRAEVELYVAYNADAIYRNPDDYKNWQLGELEAFIMREDVLHETLTRLKSQNQYWESISVEELRPMLYTYWRNAGKWRLVAEDSDSQHATNLVQTWQGVILDQSNEAISNATNMLDLNGQIQTIEGDKSSIRQQSLELTQLLEAIQTWHDEVQSQNDQQPLEPLERWRLYTIAASTTTYNPTAQDLLAEMPPPEAPSGDYLPWADKLIILLENELSSKQQLLNDLTTQQERLNQDWSEASQASHGLTAFLILEPISESIQDAQKVRLTSRTALIGGLLGVIIWGFVWLWRPIREARK